MNKFGINIKIKFLPKYRFNNWRIYNVTEILYNYQDSDNKESKRIAFESDIHDSKVVYEISDIVEFEISLAEMIHERFEETIYE